MSRDARKPVFRATQTWTSTSQKMGRGLKFWIQEEQGLYSVCRENKGAVQLHGYCAADLRHFFFVYVKGSFSHEAAHFGGSSMANSDHQELFNNDQT